jgi:hypothetical protein
MTQGGRWQAGGLVSSVFELKVFRITASTAFKRSKIVARGCGLNSNQMDFLSALGTNRR